MQKNIKNLISLLPYNTFKISAYCNELVEIKNEIQLQKVIKESRLEENFLIIGGGSNILFTKNFDGLVLKNSLKGIFVHYEDSSQIILKVASGEIWSDFVDYCVKNDWGGIENLSLIPGTVGAAPIQNIGAYGVEVKDTLHEIEAVKLSTGEKVIFNNSECKFAYRDSIFKNEAKNKYFITNVFFRLSKKPVINTAYGDISKLIKEKGIKKATIADMSNIVKEIRMNKLPNPEIIGNAGSFFKNPMLAESDFKLIIQKFPDIRHFTDEHCKVKISAAWLIENAGLKGFELGNAKVNDKQALVLINNGNATGKNILQLADYIIEKVKEKYGIVLNPEVNIL